MSLIEQALRRAQDPLMPKQDKTPKAGQHTASQQRPPQAAPAPHSWSPPPSRTGPLSAAVVVLTLIGLMLLGGVFWMERSTSTASKLPAGTPGTLEAAATAQAPLPPQETTASPIATISRIALPWAKRTPLKQATPLVLTGVVEGMGDPYAVINNMIVGEGDHVEDATLVSITDGAVRLRRKDGTETTMRVVR